MDDQHGAGADGELSPFCTHFHHAIEVIGRRWTGAILRALLTGTSRFSEVGEIVPGLSDRLLSERLKELEAEGIVTRIVIPETPVRIEYRLTTKGRDLEPAMRVLADWAERWAPVEENAPATA
jgi:DNA-binding HxlR family transcriptional regulator